MANDLMRLAGINSGYDTEAMIQKMMSAYQTKIDNQNKKLQQLQWEQEDYRSVTQKLTDFKNKYFDILKKDKYLMSPSSFSKFKTNITNKLNPDRATGVNVTTTANSKEGNYDITIKKQATATTLKGRSIAPNNFELNIDDALKFSKVDDDGNYNFTLSVKVGDVTKDVEIVLGTKDASGSALSNDALKSEFLTQMNDQLDKAFGETGKTAGEKFVKARYDTNGKMKFDVNGGQSVTITEKDGYFGLAKEAKSLNIAAQAANTGKNSIVVKVGGVTKKVTFDGVSETYYDSRKEAGNSAINDEYEALRKIAYNRSKDYPDSMPILDQDAFDNFTLSSSDAAKIKNSQTIEKALNDEFRSSGVTFEIDDKGNVTASTAFGEAEFAITVVDGNTLGIQKGTSANKFGDRTTLGDMGLLKGADGVYTPFSLDMKKALSNATANADGTYTFKFNVSADKKSGNVTVNTKRDVDITITPGADGLFDAEGKVNADVAKQFTDQINNRLGDLGVNVTADGNSLNVQGDNSVKIIEKKGHFISDPEMKINGYDIAAAAHDGANTIDMTVNGITKTGITFNTVSAEHYQDVLDKVRNADGTIDSTKVSALDAADTAIYNDYNAIVTDMAKDKFLFDNPSADPDTDPAFNAAYIDNFQKTLTGQDAANVKNTDSMLGALSTAFSGTGVEFVASNSGSSTNAKITAVDDPTNPTTTYEMTVTDSTGNLGMESGSVQNTLIGQDEVLEINGVKIAVTKDTTLSELMKAVNSSDAGVTMKYSNVSNGFVITANDMGNGGDVEIKANAFTQALGLTKTADGSTNSMEGYKYGENAVIVVDGEEVIHNSNSYTVDGTTFDFTDADLSQGDVQIRVGVTKDYTEIKETIKEFVKDYNQLIDDVFEYTATAPQRDKKNNKYEPLTDEEKEGMSDKEIEKWETAARKGMLYQDSTINSIMSSIRTLLYSAVDTSDGRKFGLYNMGITAATDYAEHGKLEIDEDKLNAALEEHADDVVKLFTDSEQGIMKKVNTTLDNAVRTTGKVKGSLVRKAGLEKGSTSKDNEIYKEMLRINERIKQLQDRYDTKEEYWWKVFTNLEKAMSNFNNQSSYMSNYMSNFGSQQ